MSVETCTVAPRERKEFLPKCMSQEVSNPKIVGLKPRDKQVRQERLQGQQGEVNLLF